ncbi:MAG: DUF4292 domain-containing protein [Planctomycetaceae bacterium]|nr:DUF4292 domain-containing protein [Planctomycetaceae bacterium]
MPKAYTLAAALTLLLALAGCGNRDRVANRQVDRSANPNVLVQNAVESRANLSSLAGKGVMRIVDQPSKFGLTVNADVVADDTDRLRIRADKLAGAIQAFDVVMLGDDVGFYIPTQKTLYHGKVQDLQNFSFRFDPDEVLQQMLRADSQLASRRWRYSDAKDPKGGLILEEDVPRNRPHLQLAINQKNGTIASITQLDARGQPLLVKRYDDYRNLGNNRRGERVTEENMVFPYMMSFSWPRDKRSMEMQFKQVRGNAPVTDEDFDIAASSDTRYRPLREAQMDPEIGDEPLASQPREPTAGPALALRN